MNPSENQPQDRIFMMALERTRLAAERTFLTWIRTGLGGVGGGIAVIHLLVFENVYHRLAALWAGQFLMLWGIFLFIYAFYSYYQVERELGRRVSVSLPSRIGIMGLTALSLTIVALVFLLFSIRFS